MRRSQFAARRPAGPTRWARVTVVLWLALSAALACAAPVDIILVLDNSGSMRKNDPAFLLKGAVGEFMQRLSDDTHAGIVIFDEQVKYPVALGALAQAQRTAIGASIDTIDYRGKYTNIPGAIERAIYELKSTARADAVKTIVFMTDGIVDTGNPAVDAEKTSWLREDLAADAADNDIRIFGIAFTEAADFFLIQSLAKKTGGEYFRALTPEDLSSVFAKVEGKLVAVQAAAAEPPPPPATEPSAASPPAAPAVAAAATTPCLAALPADERAAYEQMAVEAQMTPEQLCIEMQAAGPGTAVVTAPPAAAEDQKLGVMLVAAAAVLGVLAVVVVAVVVLRKRAPRTAPAGYDAAAAGPARIPEAFLKDINRIGNDPAVQVGAKPLMVGRVAGTDPEHLDYFVVDKPTIGRRHALIKYRDFGFWLSDQGSVNGTFLNGERIDGERQLKHGDRVRFHKYEFEFTMPELDNAGHTVFADPSDKTVIGDAILMGGAVAAAAVAPAGAAGDDDVFDLTGGGELARVKQSPDIDEQAPTAFSPRAGGAVDAYFAEDDDEQGVAIGAGARALGDDDADLATVMPNLGGTAARAEAEFDAEASAFFGEDELGVTAGQPAHRASGDDDVLDPDAEATTQFALPVPPPTEDDFSESETLLPAALSGDGLNSTSDISLDEFMRTDSFEPAIPGVADDDDQDSTLLPSQVPSRPVAIDDVFDVTAEGTIPPVDPNDDSESPTKVRP